MLRRQNLRGRHHARLATVVRSYEHGHQCDKRLSAAHIALQQAVHLPSAAHVAPHLAHHPFLRPRKAERQILRIKSIEILAHPAEHYSAETVPPLAREAQDVKLYIEQFLKLQPVLRPPEHLRISREMHIAQRLHKRHKAIGRNNPPAQSLLHSIVANHREKVRHQLLHRARRDVHPLHPLRGVVIRPQAHGRKRHAVGTIDVRMSDVHPPSEHGRLAEHDILLPAPVLSADELYPLKPHQISHPRAVREMRHQTSLPSIAESLETQNLPLELYVGHRAVYFRYAVYTAPIHILVREMIQQVPEGTDSQLLLQNFSPVRSHTWEKLDVAR